MHSGEEAGRATVTELIDIFGRGNVYVEVQRHREREEEWRNQVAVRIAHSLNVPLLATNGVRYATAYEREILDVLTAIRNHTTLARRGGWWQTMREPACPPASIPCFTGGMSYSGKAFSRQRNCAIINMASALRRPAASSHGKGREQPKDLYFFPWKMKQGSRISSSRLISLSETGSC